MGEELVLDPECRGARRRGERGVFQDHHGGMEAWGMIWFWIQTVALRGDEASAMSFRITMGAWRHGGGIGFGSRVSRCAATRRARCLSGSPWGHGGMGDDLVLDPNCRAARRRGERDVFQDHHGGMEAWGRNWFWIQSVAVRGDEASAVSFRITMGAWRHGG